MDIMIAGTLLVDTVKIIPRYPPPLALVPIIRMHRSLGGLLPNVAIDLAKLDPELHIEAVSCVGNDSNGAFVREVLSQYPNIDTSGLVTVDTPTAFTDVMTVETTGERTFFTYVGANEQLTADNFDFSNKDISASYWVCIAPSGAGPGRSSARHSDGPCACRCTGTGN